jgi:hypothetical protein
MADFCHEFDPGGLGCPHPGPCPEGCLGDFHSTAHEVVELLRPGYQTTLGICEGHGSVVIAEMDDDGVVWCEHTSTDDGSDGQATEPPKRIKVTP